MKKSLTPLSLATIAMLVMVMGCKSNKQPTCTIVPFAPNYANNACWHVQINDTTDQGVDLFYVVSTCVHDWHTTDSVISHHANVYDPEHIKRMNREISRIEQTYGQPDYNLYAPYYRHITLESWATLNNDTIQRRAQVALDDVRHAFSHFLAHRNPKRPFILAGFSQGAQMAVQLIRDMDSLTHSHMVAAYALGFRVTAADTVDAPYLRPATDSIDTGVTICYNTVKHVRYVNSIISDSNLFCINPVNWRTDSVHATLHDSITVTLDTDHKVLVVQGYEGAEYRPVLGFINIGDIHSCEPWLYSECLRQNMQARTKAWRKAHRP